MKRVLSLTAVIMATAVLGIQLILNIIDFFSIITVIGAATSNDPSVLGSVIGVLLLYLFLLAFIIVAFILTVMMYKYINGTAEEYAKKKNITITAIVFDFLICVLFIISITGAPNVLSLILSIICLIILLAAAILLIIDLVNEKKRVEESVQVRPDETNVTVNVEETSTEKVEKTEETPKNE